MEIKRISVKLIVTIFHNNEQAGEQSAEGSRNESKPFIGIFYASDCNEVSFWALVYVLPVKEFQNRFSYFSDSLLMLTTV